MNQLKKHDDIDSRLVKVETSLIIANSDLANLKSKVNEFEDIMAFMNMRFEATVDTEAALKDNTRLNKGKVNVKKIQEVLKETENMAREVSDLRARHVDLQGTSYCSLDGENCETAGKLLQRGTVSLIVHTEYMQRNQSHVPRPIVAKFVSYRKYRELVRKLAPKKLKATNYGINEQSTKK